jgi:hypothetical protein
MLSRLLARRRMACELLLRSLLVSLVSDFAVTLMLSGIASESHIIL